MQCAVSTHPYSKLYSNSIICVKSICNAFFPHKKFPKFWTLRTKSYLYLKKKMQEIFPVLISLSVCSKSKVINFFFEIPILNFDTLTYQNNLFFGKYGTYTLFLCFILVPWPMNYYYAVPLFYVWCCWQCPAMFWICTVSISWVKQHYFLKIFTGHV